MHVVSDERLAPVQAHYDASRLVEAWTAASVLGDPRDFSSTRGRILAGRLLPQVGAPRAGILQLLRALRQAPDDPEARFFGLFAVLESGGPLAALRLLRRFGERLVGTAEEQCLTCLGFVRVHGVLRDFEEAERWLERAKGLAPTDPWVEVERTLLLEGQDRREEALDAARHALVLGPTVRRAHVALADALELAGEHDASLAVLEEASRRLQSAELAHALAAALFRRERWAACRDALDLALERSPALERGPFERIAAMRSDLAYHLGDVDEAIRLAELSGSPFHLRRKESLERHPPERRVLLRVDFVRQLHLGCAPATLAAIARSFGRDVDHREIAAKITWEGTPRLDERRWAEANGFAVREFTLTWDDARALLDRGVPFTLATVEPGSAHLQAVVGYDDRRGTLLVRDPFARPIVEFDAEGTLARYAASGPRAMAVVPVERRALLEGLDLRDAELRELVHRVEDALDRNDRATAAAARDELEARAPDHPLTHFVARILAAFDGAPLAELAATERALALHPDDANTLLARISLLERLGREQERLQALEQHCRREHADPILVRALGQQLARDASRRGEAEGALRRTIRHRSGDARSWQALAELRWRQRRTEEALALHRVAACLEETRESHAWSYFQAAFCAADQPGIARALRHLERRVAQAGARSGAPAGTLADALVVLERHDAALEVLFRSLSLRPDDPGLILNAAEVHAGIGRTEAALELLAKAEAIAWRPGWLRVAARLAALRGDAAEALRRWREILVHEPLALDAHESIALLLAGASGERAALAHLEAAVEASPDHLGLLHLLYDWCRRAAPGRAIELLRRLVALQPADAWARRELALVLGEHGAFDEAAGELAEATRLEPRAPSLCTVRGALAEWAGRPEEARAAYLESLRLLADQAPAVRAFVRLAPPKDRAAALELVHEELLRQRQISDGLLAWASEASGVLSEQEIERRLRALLAARPDERAPHAALIGELLARKRTADALVAAAAQVQAFPLVSEAFLDLAAVHGAAGAQEARREALERAATLAPAGSRAAGQLASSCAAAGDHARAIRLLERAVAVAPLELGHHARLAEALRGAKRDEEALARLEVCLRLEPSHGWAWERLGAWAAATGRSGAEEEALQRVRAQHPREPRVLLEVARRLPHDAEKAREELYAEAARLERGSFEARDVWAEWLVERGRFEEADRVVTEPPEPRSLLLRGRLAWLRARQGKQQEAISRMELLLEEAPEYHWGRVKLTGWLGEVGRTEQAVESARRCVAMEPEDAVSHGVLAEALLRTKATREAISSLRAALRLDPSYSWAHEALIEALLEARAVEELDAALEASRPHIGEAIWYRGVLATALALDRHAAAEAALVALARRTHGDLEEFERSAVAVAEKLGEEHALVAIEKAARAGAERWIGRIWSRVRLRHPPSLPRLVRRLLTLPEPVRGEALAGLLDAADAEGGIFRVLLVRWLAGDVVLSSAVAWGTLGRCYLLAGWFHTCVRWLGAPPVEGGLEPWMLLNRTIAEVALGRLSDAAASADRALALGEDEHAEKLRVYRALGSDAPLGDKPDHPTRLFMYRLATAIRLARGEGARAERVDRAAAALRAAFGTWPEWSDSSLGRGALRGTLWRILRETGAIGLFLRHYPISLHLL